MHVYVEPVHLRLHSVFGHTSLAITLQTTIMEITKQNSELWTVQKCCNDDIMQHCKVVMCEQGDSSMRLSKTAISCQTQAQCGCDTSTEHRSTTAS